MSQDLSECLERHESLQYNNEFCTPPEVALAAVQGAGFQTQGALDSRARKSVFSLRAGHTTTMREDHEHFGELGCLILLPPALIR